jgi:hypothetical protein
MQVVVYIYVHDYITRNTPLTSKVALCAVIVAEAVLIVLVTGAVREMGAASVGVLGVPTRWAAAVCVQDMRSSNSRKEQAGLVIVCVHITCGPGKQPTPASVATCAWYGSLLKSGPDIPQHQAHWQLL